MFDEKQLMHDLRHLLPSQAALKDFVHHNSLHAFQDREFFEAIFHASRVFGMRVTFNLTDYRELHRRGRIKNSAIDQAIHLTHGSEQSKQLLDRMLHGAYDEDFTPKIGQFRSEWKIRHNVGLSDRVHPLLFRLIGAYLDQGIAPDSFPKHPSGLLESVRLLEKNSLTSLFHSKRAKELLFTPEISLEILLDLLVGNAAFFASYLLDQQFEHKGWSGIIGAIEKQPDTLLHQTPVDLKEFIILELLLEVDALDRALGKDWEGLACNSTHLPKSPLEFAPSGELQEVLKLWQIAFEWDYYDEVLGGLVQAQAYDVPEPAESHQNPSFQALFCIDDREDSIRRHFEAVDPLCETIGAPGFFGVAIYYRAFGGHFIEKNCPVPVTPRHLIEEITSGATRSHEPLRNRKAQSALSGLFATLGLGPWSAVRLLSDLFRPRMRPDIADAYSHMDVGGTLRIEASSPPEFQNQLQLGYTPKEMAEVVSGLLTNQGMTYGFSDFVYVIAHGSSSANNPHHGAHDCGACSGRPGAVNARVFAHMANHSNVRKILAEQGVPIESRTQFIGGMHDTASDEIQFYDTQNLTLEQQKQHDAHVHSFEQALDRNARERARRFASIDSNKPIAHIRRAIKARSVSYFEPRPELGHGTNALCYVGSRGKVSRLFLDRRAFHQSYDYRKDPKGTILKQVLNPLPIVCGGINLEYYFSRMDIEKMGAGTKLPHHVMGLFGVTNSADGDLRPGLPLQMVENHDPVRLLMIIEQEPEVILSVLKSAPTNQAWFEKGWIHLIALSPSSKELYRYSQEGFNRYVPKAHVHEVSDFFDVMDQKPAMTTNHIADATIENIAIHIQP